MTQFLGDLCVLARENLLEDHADLRVYFRVWKHFR